jgi:LysM repeat protein
LGRRAAPAILPRPSAVAQRAARRWRWSLPLIQATSYSTTRGRRHLVHASVLAGVLLYASASLSMALGLVRVELPLAVAPWPLATWLAVWPQPQLAPASTSGPVAVDDSSVDDSTASGSVDQPTTASDTWVSPVATRTYYVEGGDSVRSIARQFGVSNETIIWENDLTDPDNLSIGQQLEILPFTGLVHQARPGDTVASIANFYGANVEDVIAVNKLTDPEMIVVGQKLAVPGGYRPLPGQTDTASDGASPASGDQQAANGGPSQRILPVLGNTPQEQFISVIAPAAVKSAEDTGVPASVTIAQAIIESYWGSSRLSTEDNNYFGIKAETQPGSAPLLPRQSALRAGAGGEGRSAAVRPGDRALGLRYRSHLRQQADPVDG